MGMCSKLFKDQVDTRRTSIPASCKALTICLNSREALTGPPAQLAYRLIGAKKFIVE